MQASLNHFNPPSFQPRALLRTLLLVAATVCGASEALAQTGRQSIEQLMAQNYPATGPGAQLLVVQNGTPVLQRQFGKQNIEQGTNVTANSVFQIASISKQFTAVAMLLLEQQGRLSLRDPIIKYLPHPLGLNYGITIEHLLTHTSGMDEISSSPQYSSLNEVTPADLVRTIQSMPQVAPPGTIYRYNNGGYMLAGAIIEKVTGMRYQDYIQATIFTPLGMSKSGYGGLQLVPNRAAGYTPGTPHRNAPYMSMSQAYSAGALYSTTSDLAKWNAALFGGRLVNSYNLQRLQTPYRLQNGSYTSYSYGFELGNVSGNRVLHHSGIINGFNSQANWFPDRQTYVVLLTNRMHAENPPLATDLAVKVANFALNGLD